MNVEILKNAGFSAVRANDGGQAVDIFEASSLHEFGIILMDVQMPVVNGYEVTMAIRRSSYELEKTIPIIFMTANAFSEDIQHSLALGINAPV